MMEHSDVLSESAEKTVYFQSQLFLEIPVNDSFINKTDKCSTFGPQRSNVLKIRSGD